MATNDQVARARGRGGKPSDANRVAGRTAAQDVYEGGTGSARASDGSTVMRGPDGNVYRYNPKFDYTTIERADGTSSAPMKGNQLPGGINNYIDKVLDMSGMQGGGGGDAAAPANVPTPTPRPDMAGVPTDENIPVPTPRPDENQLADTGDDASFGEAVLSLLAGGAVGGAAKYAYDRVFGKQSPVDATIEAVDGNNSATAPMRSEAAQIEGEQRAALPAPPKRIAGPVDEMIDAVDGAPVTPVQEGAALEAPAPQQALPAPPKQLTDADAPYTPRNPSPGVQASTASKSADQVFDEAMQMGGRAGLQHLRANNIDLSNLTEQQIRKLAAASNARKAGRTAASKAVGAAARNAAK